MNIVLETEIEYVITCPNYVEFNPSSALICHHSTISENICELLALKKVTPKSLVMHSHQQASYRKLAIHKALHPLVNYRLPIGLISSLTTALAYSMKIQQFLELFLVLVGLKPCPEAL